MGYIISLLKTTYCNGGLFEVIWVKQRKNMHPSDDFRLFSLLISQNKSPMYYGFLKGLSNLIFLVTCQISVTEAFHF